jgi:hypothetical protein
LYIRRYEATVRQGQHSEVVSLESGWEEVSNFATRFRASHKGCTIVLRRVDKTFWRRNLSAVDIAAEQEYVTVSEAELETRTEPQVDQLAARIHVHFHLHNGSP